MMMQLNVVIRDRGCCQSVKPPKNRKKKKSMSDCFLGITQLLMQRFILSGIVDEVVHISHLTFFQASPSSVLIVDILIDFAVLRSWFLLL